MFQFKNKMVLAFLSVGRHVFAFVAAAFGRPKRCVHGGGCGND